MTPRKMAPLVLLLALACMHQRAVPPPAATPVTLALTAPRNQTGSELPVTGDWLLERLARGGARVSVADVLAAEMATVLAAHGVAIVSSERADVPTLDVVLERWEPEVPSLAFVRVTIEASLVERRGGRVLWSARRARWMVPTRGAPTAAAASAMAARAVVQALFGAWEPAQADRAGAR